jgi:glycosyltransferase involved in cell wall biosynthesis
MNFRKPSILYCTFDSVPSPKGASTHITYFVRALKARYTLVKLLTLNRAPRTEYTTYGDIEHIRAGCGDENFLRRVDAFREFVSTHVRKNHYDVIHFRSIWEGIPVLDYKEVGRYRTVYEANGFPSIELPYHYPVLRRRPDLLEKLKNQEAWALRNSDRVITPSALTGSVIREAGVGCEKLSIIPNGVDTGIFYPGKSEPGLFTVLYIGTLAPWQGIKTLLPAFKEMLRVTDSRLQILGAGKKSWIRECEKLCEKLGITSSVQILPPVAHHEVAECIRKAHICVAPLEACERNVIQGCCPVKIFEYMAMRKAVLATNLPVISAFLEHERDALLFQEGSIEDCAHSLLRLRYDAALREKLAGNAYTKVIEKYQWKHSCEQLLTIYEELLSTPAALPIPDGSRGQKSLI